MAVKANKKFLGVIGLACVIAGVTLILMWWPELVILFKGCAGFAIALAGMFILYNIRE